MKFLIADDHGLFRDGLRHVLAGMGESIETVEATNGTTALACAAEHPDLDLVLLDLHMPDMNGLAALEQMTRSFPSLPVVILSGETRRVDIQRALELGAMGFISKGENAQVMLQALRLVLAGGLYVPQMLDPQTTRSGGGPESNTARLTARQQEVLALLVHGYTNKDIARSLHLTEATVKMHVTAIMKALGVSNRTQAVLAAERLKVV